MTSVVKIAATAYRDEQGNLERRVYAELVCVVDWPSLPRLGDVWFHCGDWAGETVKRTEFLAPVAAGEPGATVAVNTTREVITHLVDDHGFTMPYETPR